MSISNNQTNSSENPFIDKTIFSTVGSIVLEPQRTTTAPTSFALSSLATLSLFCQSCLEVLAVGSWQQILNQLRISISLFCHLLSLHPLLPPSFSMILSPGYS